MTLPRSRRPAQTDDKMRRKLVRDTAKRPTITLRELQEFPASTGCVTHVTTISVFFSWQEYREGWQDGNLIFKRKTSKPGSILQKDTWSLSNGCGKMCFDLIWYIWPMTTLHIIKIAPYLQWSIAVKASSFRAVILWLGGRNCEQF